MLKFDFFNVSRLIIGPGKVTEVGPLCKSMGTSALVIHNAGQTGDGGATDRVASLLSGEGIHHTFVRQHGEPKIADVDHAIAVAREASCDVIVGLGGGSAIDCAKAVAGLLGNGGEAIDYMEVVGRGNKISKPAVPWIAIPTTAGTGAEVTRNAVITHPEKKCKASIRSEHLLARAAIVDPELHVAVRPQVTASSGMDALCQLIESFTSTGANPLTDGLALQGIALAAKSLARAFHHGNDLEARQEMAIAALLSGITLTNAGLGAVHGFAAPLGANFPVPHGVVCARLLPEVIRANVEALRRENADHPILHRYASVGRTIASDPGLASDRAIQRCIDFTRGLVNEFEIPRLGTFGVSSAHIPEQVRLAQSASSMRYNPITLSEDALHAILVASL